MRYSTTVFMALLAFGAGLPGVQAAVGSNEDTAAPPVSVNWVHRHATFNYYGITTAYTCESLESKVRLILLYLGARKDAKATARGCPAWDVPSHSAWVETDFYVPAPSDEAGSADALPAHWTQRMVSPRHPGFMGEGDCELMQSLKDLVTHSFNFHALTYETSCFPREVVLDSFSMKAEVLQAALKPP